ncbi:MAG: protoporphyrinogen oxidase [Myxococcota bacterium]|nr:protoporphyrinogen oxidase [Myxococcota bacterium]
MASAVVIGGGISGLACAWEIQRACPGVNVSVLESSGKAGGNIWTVKADGWTCESGPAAFLNRDPSTLELADSLGLSDELVTAEEGVRRRYILLNGRLRRFPDTLSSFLSSDLLSIRARARVFMEPLVPPAPLDMEETVADFARRRLGSEAASRLLDPVVAGIYAGDPERLSASASLPQLTGAEQRGKSLLQALVRSREQNAGQGSVSPSGVGLRRMVTFQGGMSRLVDALAKNLGDSLELESPVQRLERHAGGWTVEVGGSRPRTISADVVVSAVPASAGAGFLAPLHADLAGVCAGVPSAPVSVVGLGYHASDVPHPLDGFGYLVPSTEGGRVLGVMWSSSMLPGLRAPEGHVLMRVFMGGVRDPEVCSTGDEDLLMAARQHLHQVLGITVAPRFGACFRHRIGIPQYEIGHESRVADAQRALLSLPGLLLAGNSLVGVGVNQCTALARATAESASDYLAALPTREVTSRLDAACPA